MNKQHLHALELRLSHERSHLSAAKTDKERALRAVWIAQIEREIAGERKFLGLPEQDSGADLSDDDILKGLSE